MNPYSLDDTMNILGLKSRILGFIVSGYLGKTIQIIFYAYCIMGSPDLMDFRDFLGKMGIANFPIKVTLADTKNGVKLEDGTRKQKKTLMPWDTAGKVDWDFEDNEKMALRWKFYEEGNVDGYNYIAYDTSKYQVVDIDCMTIPETADGVANPIHDLIKGCQNNQYYWKKSSSKRFGKHIFIKIKNFKNDTKRLNFQSIYGETVEKSKSGKVSKKPGVELLNGQVGWSKMNDKIVIGKTTKWLDGAKIEKLLKNNKKSKTPTLKKNNKNKRIATKKDECEFEHLCKGEYIPYTFKTEIARKNWIKGDRCHFPSVRRKRKHQDENNILMEIVEKKPSITKKYNLQDVRKNLFDMPAEFYNDYHKWGGIIKACASSGDEEVYQICLEWSKQSTSFDSASDVRKQWDNYDKEADKERFASAFRDRYSKEFEPPSIPQKIILSHGIVGKYFVNEYKNLFVLNANYKDPKEGLAFFNGDVWQPHQYCESKIYTLVSDKVKVYFYDKMVERFAFEATYKKDTGDKKKSELTDDDMFLDDEAVAEIQKQMTKKEQEIQKKRSFGIAKIKADKEMAKTFENDTFLNGCVKWITKHLYQNNIIKKRVHFNMGDNTKNYYQFKNGAFNLKTGLLEKRTREMYITSDGVLDYNYYPIHEQEPGYDKEKADKIKNHIEYFEQTDKMILPEKKLREGYYTWRGCCLTGEVKHQQFMMNIGSTGNGKTTLTLRYAFCFPVYSYKLSGDCLKGDMESTAFNKSFGGMVDKPVRLAYITEWGEMNCKTINEIIDTDKLTVKPLYKHAYNMPVQFKLEGSLNPEHWKVDNIKATGRRANLAYYNSRFTREDEDVDEENFVFKTNPELISSEFYSDDLRKLAVFHQYAPYAKKYYEEGLLLPAELKRNFQNKVEQLDPFNTFASKNIGDSPDTKFGIHKDDLKSTYEYWADEEGIKKSDRLSFSDLKKRMILAGYKYDSQAKKTTNGYTRKAWFTNCMIVDDEEDSDDEEY